MRTILLALLAVTAYSQDIITVTVKRGTLTRTAEIPATEAFKALDYLVSTSGTEYSNETDAIRKHLVAWFVSQLRITPGTAIKSATDTENAARAAREKLEADYTTAAQAKPIQ